MSIGRNDPCPCGSLKKYKKCCLIKEEQSAIEQRKILQETFEAWMEKDQAVGILNMKEAIHNPPPNFARGSDGEKLFNEMMQE